uniref:HDC10030 n=1 Tax=Drosophila melanogaster TaxID=7227 RepID=Q6IL91_DROME|nr:TPA_inf: HDC10030 [Drosophila melanogaster]
MAAPAPGAPPAAAAAAAATCQLHIFCYYQECKLKAFLTRPFCDFPHSFLLLFGRHSIKNHISVSAVWRKKQITHTPTDEANVIKIRYTCFHKTACREIVWEVESGIGGKVVKGVRPRFDHISYGLGPMEVGEKRGMLLTYRCHGDASWPKSTVCHNSHILRFSGDLAAVADNNRECATCKCCKCIALWRQLNVNLPYGLIAATATAAANCTQKVRSRSVLVSVSVSVPVTVSISSADSPQPSSRTLTHFNDARIPGFHGVPSAVGVLRLPPVWTQLRGNYGQLACAYMWPNCCGCVYVSVALKMNNGRDLGAKFMHSLCPDGNLASGLVWSGFGLRPFQSCPNPCNQIPGRNTISFFSLLPR